MSSSVVRCADCGDSSAAVEWGFVLLARHGWTAQLGEEPGEPRWRCPACDARGSEEADGSDTARGDSEPVQRRLRVLLIDDQVLVLRATAGMLREFDVVTAGGAAEALAKLGEGSHFDVVVSDVSMPTLNGAELFAQIRAEYPHLAEQFLMLSGDAYTAARLCAVVGRREGISKLPKILEKPVPRDLLVREIEALGRRRLPRSGTFSIISGNVAELPARRRSKSG
ncbi:MAG TPA: response regulator [Polyangiaceae bacterium]|nr:response regulator [Polyangiaceae bacterium]